MKILLLILVWVVGVTAFLGGLALVRFADGHLIFLSAVILENTPFTDFTLPGMAFMLVGIINLLAAVKNLLGHKMRYNWAIASGMITCSWIALQIILIQQIFWLQFVYLAAGILIMLTAYQIKGKWAV